ncbi:PIG-L family deacetylase [Parasediminibacterium sp. JCM 36343]|uniref:PIG-L family deacetylase n=1 Tax=Parasediminibacterium sp. JCM 36343 TaxID=3374279 RepID=UPI00397922F8
MNKIPFLFAISCLFFTDTFSQSPATYSSADIYLQLKKLNVLGSVLYIAAHPDDENNGLLPYFAKEKLYRTAYLSLTRGDGGQNLIGSEQGIELGLIRTQELLAARRIDGSEQYFSRAYEFGFCKNAAEALKIWGKDKILSDVVWIIRQYQPDVIITRFPGDARAGHGHHAASSLLANEAFTAAADPTKFSEQFQYGVKPWQAKRILWNTFNFGGTNTTADDQLKIDVGSYNPLLGKSYGEIGGEARSMHKCQGEGRPRRRGEYIEYFKTTGGDAPRTDLMEGIDIGWGKIPEGQAIATKINEIVATFNFEKPALSVPILIQAYKLIQATPASNWHTKKLQEVQDIIEACSGLFAEATTAQQMVAQVDTIKLSCFLNSHNGLNIALQHIAIGNWDSVVNNPLGNNQNFIINHSLPVAANKKITQPYWLEYPFAGGSFDVRDQTLIGKAENDAPYYVTYAVVIEGETFMIKRPVVYKTVDPAKGELYQPIAIIPKIELSYNKDNFVSINGNPVKAEVHFKSNVKDSVLYHINQQYSPAWKFSEANIKVNPFSFSENTWTGYFTPQTKNTNAAEVASLYANNGIYDGYTKTIAYDHIPTITYFPKAKANLVNVDCKIVGKKIGYIQGPGDKVPEALLQMGYEVKMLGEADINEATLEKYDAIITGVRAYNLFEYLTNKHEILMAYVRNGGNLIVQYAKSNQVGSKNIKIGPYPFIVNSLSRVTEEDATVHFLLPNNPLLNYPNKITAKDFEGWVQERSTYQAEQADPRYEAVLGMKDSGDKAESTGSLLTTQYGKGRFSYVSLVLFRQLPAGVPGAYRLMANLIGQKKGK